LMLTLTFTVTFVEWEKPRPFLQTCADCIRGCEEQGGHDCKEICYVHYDCIRD
jgi:hypothetical protein